VRGGTSIRRLDFALTRLETEEMSSRKLAGSASAIVAVLALVFALLDGTGDDQASAERSATLTGQIAYAVDGDTLRVDVDGGDREYVRLVGIDTPEDVKEGTPVECGARAAARSMEGLAPEGAEVVLRIDSVAGERDGFGRLLAHAFVGGRQLELVQLRRGWAEVYRYHDQKFEGLSKFYAAQDQARNGDRGVWGRCDGDFHSSRD
jgi:micrococcal nuclease